MGRSDNERSNTGRREFLASLFASVAGLAAGARPLRGKDRDPNRNPDRAASDRPKTFTYKTDTGLEIRADVYRPDDTVWRPVLLWIHGGALIMGGRGGVDRQIKQPFLDAGYVIVSIDYRLAPETKLPQIVDDLRDAYTWLHDKGPDLFHADTRRIAVAGGSAGGYLTLMAGFCVKPRPAALVSLWGYGDPTGDWESKPSEFYRRQRLVSESDAWQGMKGPQVADGRKRGRNAGRFYLYVRQQGLWPNLVAGLDPRTQNQLLTPFCPIRNVSKDYPPTLFIHGTRDTDVPFEQSADMDKKLAESGVEHRLIAIPNAGHGLGGGNPKLIANAYSEALRFVNRHVKEKLAPPL